MEDLLQRKCPRCGAEAIRIERDRFGMRTCACGETWHPSKNKAPQPVEPPPTEESNE